MAQPMASQTQQTLPEGQQKWEEIRYEEIKKENPSEELQNAGLNEEISLKNPLPLEYQWILQDHKETDYSLNSRIKSQNFPLRFVQDGE
ncbi:UNKNOWN [Stylonychia lemnae]|uniref:Uncharacterized protein n=1 Tax=Stylonychia lemnae TaxID=5949 RepID=A0A077ZQ18_STYLE|nr:UNKNOWN [Stylonychia lemnae]|eukprot:CDW71998.1 UNKNOWN [Stylonychia lemnae]